MDVLMLII